MGRGCALLVAFACCAAVGQERMDVKTAFLDGVEDGSSSRTQMEPPMPPDSRTPRSIKSDSYHPADQVIETMPVPGTDSHAASAEDFYCDECYCREGVDPCPWCPVAGAWQRHWVLHWKPHLQASHWGYPECSYQQPFGSAVLQAEQMQIVNGLRDQQVLYDYDFYPGDRSAMLSPRGEYQLRKIIRRMEIVPYPIIIQTTIVDPKLDQARRQHLLEALQAAGVPVVPELVVVDYPPLPGLQGVEGMVIHGNLLQQTHGGGGGGGPPTSIIIGGGIGISQP